MSANDIQHGGTHYMSSYAHWDLVADLGLNYYVANATKYMTRHRNKNGREDVLKAGHYLDKYIELIEQGRMPAPVQPPHLLQLARDETVLKFVDANGIEDPLEHAFFLNSACATSIRELRYAREAAVKIASRYEEKVELVDFSTLPVEPATPVDVAAVLEPQFAPEGYWGDGRVLWKCKPCGGYFDGKDGVLPSTLHTCPPAEPDPAEPTAAYVNQG